MAERYYRNESEYASNSSMRRKEAMREAGMINEDHSAIANMPQEVMMKPYPRTGPYIPEMLDDTIRGVDEQMDADDRGRAKHFKPHKY